MIARDPVSWPSLSDTYMGVQNSRDQQARKSETIADALHDHTSTTESRGSDVLANKVVNNGTDNLELAKIQPPADWRCTYHVHRNHNCLRQNDSAGEEPRVFHF